MGAAQQSQWREKFIETSARANGSVMPRLFGRPGAGSQSTAQSARLPAITMTALRLASLLAVWLAAAVWAAAPARADEAPTKWEQLFYPFPIVGAPPQLEQQVQLFGTYFTGNQGRGF